MIKKLRILIVVYFSIWGIASAQSTLSDQGLEKNTNVISKIESSDPEKNTNEQSVYLELLGNGMLYSLNYDRMLNSYYSIRIGASFIPSSGDSFIDFGPHLTFPVLFNHIISINEKTRIENGLGTTLVFLNTSYNIIPTLYSGFKFIDPKTKKYYKIGFTPFYSPSEQKIIPSLGLAFGAKM